MPDSKPREQMLDLPEEDALEHIDTKVQRTQAQLLELRRQQELGEKQLRELEEASRRQDQFLEGRREIVDNITRSLVIVERETHDSQKRLEQLKSIDAAFKEHLDALDVINPKNWEGQEMNFINKEINKALACLDDARADFNEARAILAADARGSDPLEPGAAPASGYQMDYSMTGERGFNYWLRAGLAFTLPLLVLGLCFFVLLALKK